MPTPESPTVLRVHDLRLTAAAPPINVTVTEGEIIGLAGLDGQGQERFLEVMCGLDAPLSGHVDFITAGGTTVEIQNFHGAVKAGVAYLPRNRKTQGILPSLSVLDNFSVATLDRGGRLGLINKGAQRRRLDHYRDMLQMVFSAPSAPITSLSGGNQQKVLLARWLAAEPRLLLLNDPTRGVDLPTRLKLYDVFRQVVAAHKTTLVILSTEIEELLQLCGRVLVFREQTVFTTVAAEKLTHAAIIAGMFGRPDDH